MEYRKLPRGGEQERFSVLGLGMGGIGKTPPEEIEAIVRKAIPPTLPLGKTART